MPHTTKSSISLITETNPFSHISEIYKTLRTNTMFSAVDADLKTILLTSTQPGEGKTTTIANLAVTFAKENKKVLIVDADLRKPMQHQFFMKTNQIGLSLYLLGQFAVEEVITETHIPNLWLLPSGRIPPNPSEMLGSARMAVLINKLKEMYDVILIDSPPALAVTDAQILAALSDGVILLIHSGKVKRSSVKRALANLDRAKARMLGVVLNKYKQNKSEAAYYNYSVTN